MAKSGMDYDKMSSLINKIETSYASKIHNSLTDNVQTIVEKIKDAYSGTAAESYKTTFNTTAKKIDDTMSEIITKLKTNFESEKAAYELQEKKMAESVSSEM